MFNKQTIKDISVKNQVVLVRTDFNVPLQDGEITDDLRIRAALPTLEYLLVHGAKKLIVISHLGRPGGAKVPGLSLKPVAARLAELLPDRPVQFVADVSGPDVEAAVESLPVGGILLLENLRFYRGEEENSAEFAAEIVESTHANLFVQDGFAVVHRAHASTSAITRELPAVAGLLLEKEITALEKLLTAPKRPFYVLIGGAKVKDKEPLIEKFKSLADEIWVGGKIAADGYASPAENIHVIEDFATDEQGKKRDISAPAAAELAEKIRENAATVLWNGTFGETEVPPFDRGSVAIARAIGEKSGLTSVVCGGDTTGFVENLQKTEQNLNFSLISTGGGASLSLLTGEDLPGLDALEDKN